MPGKGEARGNPGGGS